MNETQEGSEPTKVSLIIKELETKRKEQDLKFADMARLTGTSYNAYRSFVLGERRSGVDIVEKWANALGYTLTLVERDEP